MMPHRPASYSSHLFDKVATGKNLILWRFWPKNTVYINKWLEIPITENLPAIDEFLLLSLRYIDCATTLRQFTCRCPEFRQRIQTRKWPRGRLMVFAITVQSRIQEKSKWLVRLPPKYQSTSKSGITNDIQGKTMKRDSYTTALVGNICRSRQRRRSRKANT